METNLFIYILYSLFQLVTINEKMEAEIKSLSTSDVSAASTDSSTPPDRPLTAEITSLREENVTLLSRMNSDRESAQRELTGLKQSLRRATEDNEALKGQLEKYVIKSRKNKCYTSFLGISNRGRRVTIAMEVLLTWPRRFRSEAFILYMHVPQTSISFPSSTFFPQGPGGGRGRRTEIP